MKKIAFLMALLLCTAGVFAQHGKKIKHVKKAKTKVIPADKVPQAVKDAQAKKFPKITVNRWLLKVIPKKNKPAKDFIAVFTKKGIKVKAHYKPGGKAVAIMHHYKANQIPENVKTSLAEKHPGFEIKHGVKVKLLAKNKVFYRVKLVKDKAKLIVFLDKEVNKVEKNNVPEEVAEVVGGNESDSDSDTDNDMDDD